MRWVRLRRMVQLLALALFVYLVIGTRRDSLPLLPHDLFFRLDPLVGSSSMLASRTWIAPLALGAVTLLLALVAGRAWCGWLCPLGTLLDLTPARAQDLPGVPDRWRQVKHFVLFAILFATIFGSLTLLILDPITMLYRAFAAVVMPGLNLLVVGAESALYRIEPLQGLLETTDRAMQGVLLNDQPFYPWNLLVAMVVASVFTLNAVRRRFWCRYLCPLGALLALLSKVSIVRRSVDLSACTSCRRCSDACPEGTVDPQRSFAADPGECAVCLSCVDICPTRAVSFGRAVHLHGWQPYDPSRRQALFSLGAAFIGMLLRITPFIRRADRSPVRPPGVKQFDFLSQCIRCAECIRVCPTGGLQPDVGGEGLWSPELVSRTGYCDYSCNACGQVCPTGAIPKLSLEEKRQAVIGIAVIDRERCMPWADNRDCIVCEEMCPLPRKAVELEDHTVPDEAGGTKTVRRPVVLTELCIGCGICEYQCPVEGKSAIVVVSDINAVNTAISESARPYRKGDRLSPG